MGRASAEGRVFLWEDLILFAASELRNDPHRHFAASLYVAVESPVLVEVEGVGVGEYEIALVAPNATGRIDSRGNRVVDLLIEPDAVVYRHAKALLGDEAMVTLPGTRIDSLRNSLSRLYEPETKCSAARTTALDVLARLAEGMPAGRGPDPRIRRATEWLLARIDESPSAADAASDIGLSESRFMHLFKAELGLPVRQYLLWKRLRRAAGLWSEGRSLAEIAVAAGFYDQAHFTKTVRRMIDFAPSVLADPRNVTFHRCGAEPTAGAPLHLSERSRRG